MPAAAGVGVTASLLAALLPLLLLGLSARAWSQAETAPDFSLCHRSFYQETPPQGLAADEEGLVQRCYSLPGGRRFASLYNSTCGASVYTAYCLLSQDKHKTDSQAEDDGEGTHAESPPDSEVLVPALLGGGGGEGGGQSGGNGAAAAAANPSLSAWDALVSRLVREIAVPRCNDADGDATATGGGADLFVLSGAAGLSQGEDGGCQVEALWAALCCASSEEGGGGGGGGFSVGVVKGSGEEERVLSVQELGEVAGVTALFTGLCGEAESDSDVVELFMEKLEAWGKDMATTDPGSEMGASAEAQGEAASSVSEVTQEEDEVTMSSTHREAQGGAAPSEDAAKPQEALEVENQTQGSGSFVGGALMYLLSTSVSLITAPIRPVVSTLTALPGQVTYVLGEDLAVLSDVPTGTFALFQNMVCDVCGGVASVVGLVTGTGKLCFSGIYSCSAPLVGSLYGACYDGVAGVGQLAADSVGIVGGVVDNTWSVSKFFGGTAWDYGGGYVGTVACELGHQVKTVGLGLGKLLWRVGRGLGNMAGVAGGLAGGTVGSVIENVKEAFGGE